jgi:hypothetical protein
LRCTAEKEYTVTKTEAETIAAEIVRCVIENGRVLTDSNGNTDPDSLSIEVEFEAGERDYSLVEIAMICNAACERGYDDRAWADDPAHWGGPTVE